MPSSRLSLLLAGSVLVSPIAAQNPGEPLLPVSTEARLAPVVRTWAQPAPVTRPEAPAAATEAATVSFLTLNQDPEGDMPRELAFTPDGTAVLVVNRDTDTVTFFDVATAAITDTVGVGDFPVDVAVAPDGSVAVVPNVFDDSVSILDIASRTVLATVPVTGSQPFSVAITSDSSLAVVAVINDGIASSFSLVDLASQTEVSTFASGPQGVFGGFFTPESGIFGSLFTQFALSPDNHTLVLPDRAASLVHLYDITTGLETASLATAAAPLAVDISLDGRTAVVSHESGAKTITVLNLVTQTVAASHSTGADDLMNQVIRITPDKSHAIAAALNKVIFVNLVSGATTASLSTGTVGDIEISFDGQYAFVANFNARVIDIASQSIVATMPFAAAAESAASPTEHRMVALNNRFREDIHLYSSNGSGSFFEAWAPSGEAPEADAPRTLALTPDGFTAVVTNNISRNVSIVDLATSSVRATVDTGDRPLGIAVTPDGSHAVVCNGDDDTVSIIDLATDTRVAQLAVATRPSEVAISPDSSTAYVTSVSGTDRVHFISLAGAASTVTGSLVAGQMGSIGYTYSVSSGITASPDGAVVAVCISFADQLLLIDAATHAELVRVTVGDFPVRVAFTPDGSVAVVANSFSNDLTVVNIAGAASSVLATVPGIDFPLVVVPDDTGSYMYAGNFSSVAPKLFVIDMASHTAVASLALSSAVRAAHYSALGKSLFLATTGGDLVRVNAAGPASTVADTTTLSGSPADLVYSESLRRAVATQPGAGDGLDVVDDPYFGLWTDLGQALAGSHGAPLLVGAGTLEPGSPVALTLANALEDTTFGLVIGLSQIDLPFMGGTLVPALDVLLTDLPTGPTGNGTLQGTWPPGVPSGTVFIFQDWILDPAGPQGLAASNAVLALAP